jgi:hypothetical protein
LRTAVHACKILIVMPIQRPGEMTSSWQPFREPLRRTLLRTGVIALVGGAALSRWWGGLDRWPFATLLVFWFSFGGHWVEVGFLNGLRPWLPPLRAVQIVSRIGVWFVGGIAIGHGVALSALWLTGLRANLWPAWWLGGVALIAVELVAHLVLQLRGQPSFYNGRG